MSSMQLVATPVKALMIVVGLGVGALDVKEKAEELNVAMQARSAHAIGHQMVIANPYFLVETWGGHLAACSYSTWCFRPTVSPGSSASTASWAKVGPVYVARMAVLPIIQTGRTVFNQGWTARLIFAFSLIVAFLILRVKAGEQSVPGGTLMVVLGFLAVSVAVSFAFNLLLRFGNYVAGYWGVLAAIATGIYFTLEFAGKARELMHLMGGSKKE